MVTTHLLIFTPEDTSGPAVHDLKTTSDLFRDIWHRRQAVYTCDNDRDFRVGDTLRLLEWRPAGQPRCRAMRVRVTSVRERGNQVVMGIEQMIGHHAE